MRQNTHRIGLTLQMQPICLTDQTQGFISQPEFLSRLIVQSQLYKTVTAIAQKSSFAVYNIAAAFDIEVSSFYQGGRHVDASGKVNNDDKRAIMYIWQFGINDMVTYGRTWEEYIKFTKSVQLILNLSDKLRLYVYVHNLPYEFQFIRKRHFWSKVFLLDPRKPVYARDGGLEFRCSLKLAGGKSLENVGKDLRNGIRKKVGQLDYELVRTPETPLTAEELEYCEYDIRVLLEYIHEKIEDDGDITKIPLTNTGYVRNYCRKACYKNWRRYRSIMDSLVITGPLEYDRLKKAFMGGHTHASAQYVGKLLENVASYDIGSSYPSNMVLRKFPMSTAHYIPVITEQEEFERLLKTKCCIFDILIENIRPKLWFEHPISISKCWLKDLAINDRKSWDLNDNGRLITAKRIAMTITEVDYQTFKEFYEWDSAKVVNMFWYEKSYLPKAFVKAILKLYSDKTKLKGIAEKYINYMISKNMINSAYGMTVTDIVREIIEYVNELDDYVKTAPDVATALDKYNKNPRRFLFYPWGIWVTAYARRNLFKSIVATGPDFVYADTDSNKFINYEKHKQFFDKYNENIMSLIQKSAQHFNLPIEMYMPETKNGIKKPIGLFEYEGSYDQFKTLGAKRYLIQKDGEYELTLAGCGKRTGCEYLKTFPDPFSEFRIDLDNKKDSLSIPAEYSNRLLTKFIDDEHEGDVTDYLGHSYHYHELSAIHMEPEPYKLTADDAFLRFIKGEKWELNL